MEQIGRWLRERHGADQGGHEIRQMLAESVEKRLMVREGKLPLSLAVMHHGAQDERR